MQKSGGNSSRVILLFSLALLALLLSAPAVLAQTGTRLYLQPVSSVEGVLMVDVMAENVTDLYGLEVHLKYDPAILEAQDGKTAQEGLQVEPGTLLPVDKGFVVANKIDPAEGKITYAITLLNPAPPVTGAGSVARITFRILQNIPSTIEIEQGQLVAFNLETIPAELTPFAVAGRSQETEAAVPAVTATAPAPLAGFPWWIVAALVILLGLMTIGGVLLLGNFDRPRSIITTPQPTQPASARRTGSGRPSAFK